MTSNKNLKIFFNQYEDIIQTGFQYDYSEKEIFNAIYSKEFNNYLRKGWHPRLDELNYVMNFVRKFRDGELNVKDNSNIQDEDKNKLANNIRNVIHNLDIYNKNKNDMITYENERFRWFETIEGGIYNDSYDDLASGKLNDPKKISERIKLGLPIKGNVTIGIGFNMDANKEEAWNAIFLDKNTRPDFNDVLYW